MTRWLPLALIVPGALAGVALAATPRPAALAQTVPGLWELSGVPGAKAPVRECVAAVEILAQFEHRRSSCTRRLINDGASTAVIDYSCNGGGFGRSKLTALTPRSLRIETQGISDNLPFGYVLQARRVGDCPERG